MDENPDLATDEEVEEIYARASAQGYLLWPEIARIINRLRAAEDELEEMKNDAWNYGVEMNLLS